MKTRLVYHLYYNKSDKDNIMHKIHYGCLTTFSGLFDQSVFYIVLDDVNDAETIEFLKNKIYSCGFKKETTRFEIRENTEFRDSATFNEEIASKLGEFDGKTFFGHNKGTTNIHNPEIDNENIFYWVMALYYFNLSNKEDINNEDWLIYGSPITYCSEFIREYELWDTTPKFGYTTTGTFFWINEPKLKKYIEDNGIDEPIMKDRFFAENYAGNIIPLDMSEVLCFRRRVGYEMQNLYMWGKVNISDLYRNTDIYWKEFMNLYDKIITRQL